MMSMNVSVEVALGGGSNARLLHVMAARKPLANWQLLQHQVNNVRTRKTVIRAKWLDLVNEFRGVQTGGKTCNVSLIPLSTVKFNLTNQYSQNESYQEAEKVFTVQQSHGEELFIKVPGYFKELPLDAAALARLLVIVFSIPFSIQIFKENPPEEAIPAMILIVVSMFVLVQQMEGINHLAPNLLRDGMQTATNKQFQMLCYVGVMSLSGTHAGDSSENIGQSWNAVDGNAQEKGDYFKAAAWSAAWSLTLIAGGAAAWWMLRRPANPEFDVDGGLMRSPILRKSNPISDIPQLLAEEPYP